EYRRGFVLAASRPSIRSIPNYPFDLPRSCILFAWRKGNRHWSWHREKDRSHAILAERILGLSGLFWYAETGQGDEGDGSQGGGGRLDGREWVYGYGFV